jgi:O-acetylhomoserine (thiol)-lyase
MPDDVEFDFDTLQVHAAQVPDPVTGSRAQPIYPTGSYVFDSAQHAADVFAGRQQGNQYGRMHNPTVQVFADRVAALEGAQAALGLSSGQAATTTTLFALARPGAEFVVSRELFGGTFAVARKLLEPFGCTFHAVEPTVDAIAARLSERTVGIWVETISNPGLTVPDLAEIGALARSAGVPFIVDNTWGCGGYLCRPIAFGADIVVHSATKWISGHGNLVAGVLLDAGTFDWSSPRFPAFHAPDARGRSYIDKGGDTAFNARAWDLALFTMGMTLAPFTAFLALQGLETLSLRVQRACDSSLELARWLQGRAGVAQVHYPGLEAHPSHRTAGRTLANGYGAVLCFEADSEAGASAFLDRVRLASHLANLGDAKTLVIHPWTTTHAGLSEQARRDAGVTPELIRVSVGIEAIDDLKRDFAQALAAVPVAG